MGRAFEGAEAQANFHARRRQDQRLMMSGNANGPEEADAQAHFNHYSMAWTEAQ